MKILFIDIVHPSLKKELEKLDFICHTAYRNTKKEIKKIIGEYNGIVIRSRFTIDKPFLKIAKNLKFIARAGSGTENIDLNYAKSRNIFCLTAGEGNKHTVAEHALGMILSLFHKINKANQEIKKGIWEREKNRGIELRNKTIAIIGVGNTGSAFVEILKGLKVRILTYDKYKDYYDFASTMKEIFENTDILSLHVPLTPETYNMCNKSFIKKFKKPIYIINTSRGDCMETSALVDGLIKEKILGVCLDVFEDEKQSFDNLKSDTLSKDMKYLMESKQTILTPHIAGSSYESNYRIANILKKKIYELSKTR